MHEIHRKSPTEKELNQISQCGCESDFIADVPNSNDAYQVSVYAC